jgi:hypothetical protein
MRRHRQSRISRPQSKQRPEEAEYPMLTMGGGGVHLSQIQPTLLRPWCWMATHRPILSTTEWGGGEAQPEHCRDGAVLA